MTVQENKVVAISYKLSLSTPEAPKKLAETVDEKKPMYFIVGMSGLPEAFEENLSGLKSGDSFDFSIRAAEGFGEFDENEVFNLPMEDFLDESGQLDKLVFKVGAIVPMMDEEGHQVNGRVMEINELNQYIRMDFNHPLAGQDMHFEGKIVLIRDATAEEIDHGHVHGEGGHHHH